jgi:hypothetical protein
MKPKGIDVLTSKVVKVTEDGCVYVSAKMLNSNDEHEYVIAPGENYDNEYFVVHAICKGVHIPEVIAAYKALQVALDEPVV